MSLSAWSTAASESRPPSPSPNHFPAPSDARAAPTSRRSSPRVLPVDRSTASSRAKQRPPTPRRCASPASQAPAFRPLTQNQLLAALIKVMARIRLEEPPPYTPSAVIEAPPPPYSATPVPLQWQLLVNAPPSSSAPTGYGDLRRIPPRARASFSPSGGR